MNPVPSSLSPPSSLAADSAEHAPEENGSAELPLYAALSKAAVTALLFGLLSAIALAAELFLIVPLIGLAVGFAAVRKIRRYPEELSGRGLARAAIVLNCGWLIGGTSFHAVVYATELPPGCQRISFADLQPTKDAPHLPVPPRALDLDGQRVFVKGYVYPDGQRYNIQRFVLIPDMGTCCFGGQPKLTDMIEVTLRDPHRTLFERRLRRLAGILKVDRQLKPVSGLGGVYYQLDADYVR